MKTLIFFILCFGLSLATLAQAPKAFKYQAIARDNTGQVIANQKICMSVALLNDNQERIYSEIQEAVTNEFGLIVLEIGNGTERSGDLSQVEWNSGNYFLHLGMDMEGGRNFEDMGTSQLLSVPYALYAEQSGTSQSRKTEWLTDGDHIYNANTGNVGVGTMNPSTILDVNGVITATGGNSDQWNEAYGWGNHADEGYLTSAWSLTGNSGTDPLLNFIGTTDDRPLKFRINNKPAGEIDSLNRNTSIGYRAFSSNTVGIANTAIGYKALLSNTLGNNNTANGSWALYSNTTGEANTANGSGALYTNTSGWANTAVGGNALVFNTIGSLNTAIGANALLSNTTGEINTAIGADALRANTEGSGNTANGEEALRYNTTGQGNTASGLYSLYSNTTGSENTASGFWSLYNNIIGNFNTASGVAALQNNQTGDDNTASGYYTLNSNTTGYWNTAYGSRSLFSNTTGNQNTALGYLAGYSNTAGTGNVFLGYEAGYNETGSNKLYIANNSSDPPLIYGDFSTGKVGIGTQAPNEKIEVEGKIRSNQGFNFNGADGLNDTINQVTAFDFTIDKLKYRTFIYAGGILIYTSAESEWIENVGDFILPFECGTTLVDNHDGQSYATVLIGTQCWMAENLNVGTMIEGTIEQSNNGTIEKYCYDNNEANCAIYGGLYQWNEAMQYVTTEGAQGICPAGWHLPTDGEWTTLTDYLGGTDVAGGKMKSSGTIEEGTGLWYSPNTGATNESGFTGLPGGTRDHNDESFILLDYGGYFLSSSQYSTTSAWYRSLTFLHENVQRSYYGYKSYGFSVRCLQDQP